MRRMMLVVVGLVLMVTSAWAEGTPRLGFKDIYLGMPEEVLRAICEEQYREEIDRGYPGWKSRSLSEKKEIRALDSEWKHMEEELQRQAPSLSEAEKKARKEEIGRKGRAIYRLSECYDEMLDLYRRSLEVGTISLRSATIHLKDQKVGGIRLTLSRDDYKAMEAALTEKYGPPLLRTTEVWKNKLGAAFNSELLTWELREGTILMRERSHSLDISEVFIASYTFLDASEKERKSRIKKDAEGL